jgi:hypothetical protein
MVAARGQFRLSFSIERVRTIYRFGRAMIPVALGIFALQQGSVYVIYLFGDKADLADYRLASSLATIAGYGIGSFNAASGPLKQSPLQRGIDSQQANAWLLTYFVIFALGVLVVLSAVADWLVKIAPGSYSGAAALIPAIGGSYCAWGLYQMSYRTSALAGGRRLFSWLAVANVAVFAILSALLVPSIGPFGAALAATGGFMTGALTLLITSQRSATRLPLAYGRLAAAVLAAAICAASPRLAADLDLPLELAVDAGAILAYPILLIVTRALPLAEAKTLLGAARDILPGRAERRAMAARAQTLSPRDLSLATPVLRPPRPRLRRASITRTDPLADAARITAYLAGVREDVREAAPTDEILGQYLFAHVSMARRAQLANELLEAGVPGLDVDLIEGALREIQRLPSSAWPGPDARRRKRFRRLRRSRPPDY